jgi:hypothetical protein
VSALRAGLIALALALAGMAARAEDHKAIQLIYIGAYNCIYCKQWELFSEPPWRKRPEAAKVEVRKIMVPFFERTNADASWPEDLRWVRDQTNVKAGTPRFIVVVDHRIVQNAFGLNGWNQRTVPLLADLVARRSTASTAAAPDDADAPRPTRD